ncbi:MAG TPA: DoxX family protein [Candidatus Sumerlaeota bacterium]|mgnify:CR=1 FL=1|nr:DoxX family protein [Candidatus Sumerlaeota bacterium]HPS00800.1 DoxX family protein [Candidatus Sumerlaeota bacterium]
MPSYVPDFSKPVSAFQKFILALLRMTIGWHFLYEGVIKVIDPKWSSAPYLLEARGYFAEYFHVLVGNERLLHVVNNLNSMGLTLIGACLLFGLVARPAAFLGAVMLGFYYLAQPPLPHLVDGMQAEGSYLIVNKNLVELFGMLVLTVFPSGQYLGLDGFLAELALRRNAKALQKAAASPAATGQPSVPSSGQFPVSDHPSLPRRSLIKHLVSLPIFAGFVYAYLQKRQWDNYEEKHLIALGESPDALSGATIKAHRFSKLEDLKGTIPTAKIGDLEISRLILGGNLIGGWAHSRDLLYVSTLVKAYHTDKKIFDTFRIAEQCGVNTIITNPILCRIVNKYWRTQGGKMQFISDCCLNGDIRKGIDISLESGASACYLHGGTADSYAQNGQVDKIAEALELIRKAGVPAGIGAHNLATVKACVEAGVKPDFWMKTLHHTNYWSAQIQNQNDNIWCENPEETIAYMETVEAPWIAFKVMAAGAISPQEGFSYAFKNGADFVCAGMYDFQIVDDVNIALDVLASDLQRKRPWRAV